MAIPFSILCPQKHPKDSSALTQTLDSHLGRSSDDAGMAQTVCIMLSFEDRARLAAVIQDRNTPQKHVQRARIISLG
jgi:hypothetical protein